MAYPILLSVGMYYAKLGRVRPAVGAVVGEGRQKSIVRSCQLLPMYEMMGLKNPFESDPDLVYKSYAEADLPRFTHTSPFLQTYC